MQGLYIKVMKIICVGFEVVIAVVKKSSFCWDIMPLIFNGRRGIISQKIEPFALYFYS
jgi:hypothetical protein